MTDRRAAFAAIFLGIILVLGLFSWESFVRSPLVTAPQGLQYTVKQGASYKMVSTELHQQNILSLTQEYYFNFFFRLHADIHQLKAGEYLFPAGSTPGQMINQIVTGVGLVQHAFTIVPGMTFQMIREGLNKEEKLNHKSQYLSDDAIMEKLNLAQQNPEGMFYPDTYYYVAGLSDFKILRRASVAMQDRLNKAWATRSQNLPYQTPYQALIAASIIEKETGVKSELPMIAGVLVNRLRQGMLLQFDPTVIYGAGRHADGKIYKLDLHSDNPYNTYIHKGLPPTPISMPSLAAIEAVMNPQQNDYLYFVATGDGQSHQFSRTLAEHYAAVQAARKAHPLSN